jgi:hypothetical protein
LVLGPPDGGFGTIGASPDRAPADPTHSNGGVKLAIIMFATLILHGALFVGYHLRVACGKPIQAVVQTSYKEADWSSKTHRIKDMITALRPDGSVTDGLEVDTTMKVGEPVTLLVVDGFPSMTDVGDKPIARGTRWVPAFFIVMIAFVAAKAFDEA